MKIKIKNCNGELPSYLTVGKEYECFVNFGDISFPDDVGVQTYIDMNNCRHLNGGSWEVVDE